MLSRAYQLGERPPRGELRGRPRQRARLADEPPPPGRRIAPRRGSRRQRAARSASGRQARCTQQDHRRRDRPPGQNRRPVGRSPTAAPICRSSAAWSRSCSTCSTSPIPSLVDRPARRDHRAPQALYLMNSPFVDRAGRSDRRAPAAKTASWPTKRLGRLRLPPDRSAAQPSRARAIATCWPYLQKHVGFARQQQRQQPARSRWPGPASAKALLASAEFRYVY